MLDIPAAERLQILTENDGWFGRAPADFQDAVLGVCEWRTCPAGDVLYSVVDERGDVIGIVEGSIDIYSRYGPDDNPLLHIGHEGAWVGAGVLLADQPRRATIIARSDTSFALAPARAMRKLLAGRPEWWRVLATGALEYGDFFAAAYGDALIPDSARRCAAALLRITGLRPPRRFRIERASVVASQEELAGLANVSRSTLVQILKGWERDELIEQGYRTLRVRDPDRLEAVATNA